jgi:hypothetical protein
MVLLLGGEDWPAGLVQQQTVESSPTLVLVGGPPAEGGRALFLSTVIFILRASAVGELVALALFVQPAEDAQGRRLCPSVLISFLCNQPALVRRAKGENLDRR